MSNQKIRFHRRVGFSLGGEVKYVDKGDHVDLPAEVVNSPYFKAVMGEGLVEVLTPGAAALPQQGDTQAELQQAKDAAAAAHKAVEEAKAEAENAKAEAESARAAKAHTEDDLKKAHEELAALKKAAIKEKASK